MLSSVDYELFIAAWDCEQQTLFVCIEELVFTAPGLLDWAIH